MKSFLNELAGVAYIVALIAGTTAVAIGVSVWIASTFDLPQRSVVCQCSTGDLK